MADGLSIAIDQTVKIAQVLPHKDNKTLYTKTVQSIFDDQLRAHTKMNRMQRHNARKLLKKALKDRAKR